MIRMTTDGRFCLASYDDFTDSRHFAKAVMKKAKTTEPPADIYLADVTISPMGAVRFYSTVYHPEKPEGCELMWIADFGEGETC